MKPVGKVRLSYVCTECGRNSIVGLGADGPGTQADAAQEQLRICQENHKETHPFCHGAICMMGISMVESYEKPPSQEGEEWKV